MSKARLYYLLAILLALMFHGTLLSFTHGNTYDAYVHMFFGSHYAEGWFETWNYKWYTGFTMTSYPPLVHQIIAIFSFFLGLKGAFILMSLIAVGLFIRGVFHFSRIWVSETAAAYASLLAVLSSSYLEAVHIFGQLPSITGIALLLNACPELYKWIRFNKWSYFITGISIIACMTCAHHVTTIFGMVFFIAPVLGVAVLDISIHEKGGIAKVRAGDFLTKVLKLSPKAVLVGVTIITLTIIMIFPYWYWSKTDPILQVSIPHGSRASFIEDPSLGLVFFLIPWGIMLLFLPGIFHKIFHKRNLFLGLSFALLFVLGTGGTTPIPKMILGENAFNILTLERFTFWGSIIALPFFGQLLYSMIEGNLGQHLIAKFNSLIHKILVISIVILMIIIAGLVINFANFKPLQPKPIDMDPISAFMERDGHDRWRYMTLGFGDQMAWLSANTTALSVDGNYHSARRLPELTTRAVERIENSKYLGEEGLTALRDFLSRPSKYHLKYVFSNDKFYEPLLYFYGWSKLGPLENSIVTWERQDVPPLPTVLPKKDIPIIQRLMWGLLPLGSLFFALMLNVGLWFARTEDRKLLLADIPIYDSSKKVYSFWLAWFLILFSYACLQLYQIRTGIDYHKDPNELVHAYFHALDFKKFDEAYSFLDAKDKLSYEQYSLELSLEDGILASYAKLDTLEISTISEPTEDHRKILVKAKWFTAVQQYYTEHQLDLYRRKGKWFIQKPDFERATPPDQIINIPDINFHNQGHRKAEVGNISREDILDRPVLYVTSCNLVKYDEHYYIVGEVMNIDNEPAFVTLEGKLFNKQKQEIYVASADETIVHNLLPKESTAFRIDFDKERPLLEGVTTEDVTSFALFAISTVTDDKLYKFYGLRNLELNTDGGLIGQFDNYGNKEISIPQIIVSTAKNNSIRWVESVYIDRGIRPQREKRFSTKPFDTSKVFLKAKGDDLNIIINGSKRSEAKKLLPPDWKNSEPLLNPNGDELQIYLNGFVAN